MIPADLMEKYKYSYVHSCEILNEPFVKDLIKENQELKNQQKEFIEYMNKTIEKLECVDVDDEEMKGYLIQRIDTFKEILLKYRSIIGVSNDY